MNQPVLDYISYYCTILPIQIADQRTLEAELWTTHGVRVEFMTLAEIADEGRLGEGNALYVKRGGGSMSSDSDNINDNDNESLVSLTYFRAGNSPNDYPSEKEWRAREMIERSAATKCPTVGYQLAGTVNQEY